MTQLSKGFKKGDEQGNEQKLREVVAREGEGAIDLLKAVLEDTVEVGGIYSNLKNVVLELMHARFSAHPKLAKSLWRAIEIDEYLDIDTLYLVARAYDEKRALALLMPHAEQGVPAALQLLVSNAAARPKVIKWLEQALAGDAVKAGRFIEALGNAANESELASLIIPRADDLPAAAEVASKSDPARARTTAQKLASKDLRWRAAAAKALAFLPTEEIFERVSVLFVAADRTKPAARDRLGTILWSSIPFEDSRWLGFLQERLEEEEHKKVRGLLINALSKIRPVEVAAIANAPKDDADGGVLSELQMVLGRLRSSLHQEGKWEQEHPAFLESLRVAAASAKGKHKKLVEQSLKTLSR